MSHLYVRDGYFNCEAEGREVFGFRHTAQQPMSWFLCSKKPAIDEGMPAELVRWFPAVPDDFGTLVEVPA